jgi:hypothetical protein
MFIHGFMLKQRTQALNIFEATRSQFYAFLQIFFQTNLPTYASILIIPHGVSVR